VTAVFGVDYPTFGEWLREHYRVEEPKRREGTVPMCHAFDKESGEEVGRWFEGGRVPGPLVDGYYAEVPEAAAELAHAKLHRRPQAVSLH
jgi:hypothetical protein